jgi:hypothetical protein
VVHHETGAVRGELDVELGEEGDEGVGCRDTGAEGHEDVTLGVEEVDEEVGRQIGAEAWCGLAGNFTPLVSGREIPFVLVGKKRMWSYERSPRWNRASDSLLGVSNESWNPLPAN